MSANTLSELKAFREFLDEQIERGRVQSSPEQVLELWRRQQDLHESVAAVREALAEMDAGDTGQPLDEFMKEFRARQCRGECNEL